MRVGFGYDVHRLACGRKLILGGVQIPFEKGLDGHSDADVLLHAITDAVLGALALGDIGSLFPDSDPAFKDADSRVLLRKVWELAQNCGYKLQNLDCTICAAQPKLAPHILQMRENITSDLACPLGAVSVKATTEEGLGVSGAGGISAYCVILLTKI
ncbi:MAG: 2-C-methyl-D-erythritol 2,4-cyclodiphosphate synthase [Candidatus Cloacimonadaceae bacterium]|jgi:2-C-methyl-D-erythritol 2,4-cyclodiphosphate synthase|nr:2-C-methyl-D-erythritol 2,4-cyclodiphosphate synthase [Candidatus Cloacimonadota bacterium]MDX9948867.1 2-C-methyl-D-erythritol 2,4-cyclodiphosphate synthase [Candidatus Syntrophosphaera sp.]